MPVAWSQRVTSLPRSPFARLWLSTWRQAAKSPVCPLTPRLDGSAFLVTGGVRGIGLATSRGLAARGATVVAASRGADGEREARRLREQTGSPVHFLALDLADLDSVRRCVGALGDMLAGRPLDGLIANAGLWPTRHARSAQGHEIAFATNVLGHYALIRGLERRGLLAERARVVIVTGDIYVLAHECSSDFAYSGTRGGQQAYCRSKLGDLWLARELSERYPGRPVFCVHPGVIASGLAGGSTGVAFALKRALLLSPEAGAQTSLMCATQPGLVSGAYYHNCLGRVQLPEGDPALDAARARSLWRRLEELSGIA